MTFDPMTPCLFCGKPLGIIPGSRGCHRPCYGRLREVVRRGESTWEQLENQGRCSRPKPLKERGFNRFIHPESA